MAFISVFSLVQPFKHSGRPTQHCQKSPSMTSCCIKDLMVSSKGAKTVCPVCIFKRPQQQVHQKVEMALDSSILFKSRPNEISPRTALFDCACFRGRWTDDMLWPSGALVGDKLGWEDFWWGERAWACIFFSSTCLIRVESKVLEESSEGRWKHMIIRFKKNRCMLGQTQKYQVIK